MDDGEDPDYRFSLANERTFLAWVRTSLALLAGAVAVAQIVPPFEVRGARTALAVLLAVSGLGVAALAYRRWSGNERAMRHRTTLPHTTVLAALVTTLCVIAVAILVLVAL
jgi:putative membrane protein